MNTKRKKIKINYPRFIITISILMLLIFKTLFSFIDWNFLDTDSFKKEVIANNRLDIESNKTITTNTVVEDKEIITDIIYPTKPEGLLQEYYDYMITAAEQENISIEAILSIITVENRTYDVNAYNLNDDGSFDSGLCQVNSKYVEYFEKQYDIENFNPLSPYQSITFITKHFKYLANYGIEKYNLNENDSYIFAAGAYNRGLGNECKYRNMYEYKEEFIEVYFDILNDMR